MELDLELELGLEEAGGRHGHEQSTCATASAVLPRERRKMMAVPSSSNSAAAAAAASGKARGKQGGESRVGRRRAKGSD